MTKDEALTLALEALNCGESQLMRWAAIAAIEEALAQHSDSVEQEPVAWHNKIVGMEVSVDVSTGDHDAGHRLYGVVNLVQQNQKGKHKLILLVQDPEPNFKAQPEQKPAHGIKE